MTSRSSSGRARRGTVHRTPRDTVYLDSLSPGWGGGEKPPRLPEMFTAEDVRVTLGVGSSPAQEDGRGGARKRCSSTGNREEPQLGLPIEGEGETAAMITWAVIEPPSMLGPLIVST